MMGRRQKLKSGDEVDAISWGWRHMAIWRAGDRKKIKKKLNKRERKDARATLTSEAA